jgi:nitric oxide reductase large subunit
MRRIIAMLSVMAVMLAMSVASALAAPTETINYSCISKSGEVLITANDVPRGGGYAHNFKGVCDGLGGKVTKKVPPPV